MNRGVNKILTASLGVFGLLAIIILSHSARASGCSYSYDYDYISPYLGVAAQIKNLEWDPDRGGNLFRKNYLEGDVFVGLTLNDFIGIEGGYESTTFTKNDVNVVEGQNLYGNSVAPLPPPVAVTNKFLLDGWHISLLGYVPISEDYCTQLYAGVGLNRSRIYHASTITAVNVTLINPFSNTLEPPFISPQKEFLSRKTLLRLSVGIQSMLADCFGFRVFFHWINTSKFGTITAKNDPLNGVRVEDSFSYGIGLFVKF